ncbi:lipopolysaccharide kinase InaA family protein [Flavobacterium succinicans]|uniref:Kdo domain containing protein n=1 Tax=Flavobacterium succinicans TaxID=29536 RepID=A0A199XSF5_9FLAO|nr:lipopolysaccharide kinase InaA family protein [Flavobacterium succinicans]OAZ04352.1 hypothetical protein FLB_13470 [Flavobacterium succinicans]
MNFKINPIFENSTESILDKVKKFSSTGELFGNGDRNKIKLFDLNGKTINIKSFKIPNVFNKVAYKYFRKSKAKRSFEYARILLEKGIGTPQPIAFFENFSLFGLKDSYYVSEHLNVDLTYREIVEISNYFERENILRQFAKFTFNLHEKGIEFLDHSPGNTLIKKIASGQFNFYLVDLNRMKFHDNMDFETRMKNLRRITARQDQVEVISEEYAKWYGKSKEEVFEKMWYYTSRFQEKYKKRQRIKQKLKF